MDNVGHTREHVAAAHLERWCVTFGRSSVAVVAMVLGKLCERYGVDPADAVAVVHAAAGKHGAN